MATATRPGSHTFEDFCTLVPDGQKADLVNGVIYVASPENLGANSLFLWLAGLLDDYVQAKDLGWVFGSRVAFRLGDKNAPEPDIGFVARGQEQRLRTGFVDGPPDLAVEIVSPESVDRDYERKRRQYEQAGVREYWIVDEMESQVVLLRLGARGKFREIRPRRGVLLSEVVTGFWLRPEWLWRSPRPKKLDVLQQILAGPRPHK
jgi:Uma2 family endonuclease